MAGGSGDLTRELLHPKRGCAEASVVCDPRQDTKRCGEGLDQVYELFDIKIERVRQMCQNKDILLGMHPDGAVNFIIEAACTLKLNFAIIPCCVFPSKYPRKLNDGKEVVLRDDLVLWIIEECQRRHFPGQLEIFSLAFDGANKGVCGIINQ